MKSFEKAPSVDLAGVVRAMRALGKSPGEIVAEVRSGLECNAGLGESVPDLLEALLRDGSTDLLGKLSGMLNEKGFAIDTRITESFGGLPPRRSRSPKASPKAAADLGQASNEPLPDLNVQISKIKSCAREKDLHEAVRVFNQLKQSGMQLNSMVYNCLIDACVQCGDVRAALGYFEQMKQLGVVDVVSYNTMVKAYLLWGQVQGAQALLQDMSRRGLPPNKVTYNELLNARVMAKDRRGVWSLIEDMKAAGVAPSPATCSILLKSLTTNSLRSDVTRTMALLERMDEPMDEVLFGSVIEACIRIGQLEQLWGMMQRYAKKGSCRRSPHQPTAP